MSRNIKIFTGPNNYQLENVYIEEENEILIGVDSGCEELIKHQIIFDYAIGDFDSIHSEYLSLLKKYAKQIISLPKMKDMTDLAFTLDYIYNNLTYDEVFVYGGIGGRIDHLLANLNLMKRFSLSFKDNHHHIYTLKKGRYAINNVHKYISFFALEDVYELTLRGFKYELDQYLLTTSDSIGVSNEGSGSLEFSKGRLLVVCSNE
ncbi:MAG: thiamine diphosphokinase [Candidatus Izemoplasmatales bacterium]